MTTKDLKRLSRSEKILLVQDLWDDIAAGSIRVSDEEITYANQRLSEIERDKELAIPWNDVKAGARKHK